MINVIRGLASIIVPTYQHGSVVAQAIDSALAQTAPVEVIVVNDGSTDNTREVFAQLVERERDAGHVVLVDIEHGGPSAARNAGIDRASGEFVMFLDADDVIAPNKVERQIAEFATAPRAGWVICDTRIEEVGGRVELASQRYGYADMRLDGWIAPLLAHRNFIPIHAPLIRHSALGDLRFDDANFPEDWFFWHALASRARCSYVPDVLATYRKRTGSRNASRRGSSGLPGIVKPLRLNLGCGTPDSRSWHPIDGMLNLDKSMGWKFEDGLRDFADASVAGITVSHALMYVARPDWAGVFAEFARVLELGGVLRVTEDDATNRASARFGGWKGSESALTIIDARLVREHMERVGLHTFDVGAAETHYRDPSLMQAQHGAPPDVFFIEGVRLSTLLFEPHADDCALFASFTIARHAPAVVTVFPSAGDYGDTDVRMRESQAAVAVLGGRHVAQWDGRALEDKMRAIDAAMRPTIVWAPSQNASHPDHVATAIAAADVFGSRLRKYHTYNADGKVREGVPVAFDAEWVALKRRALACYVTQLQHPRAKAFFADDLAEYAEP